MLRVKNLTVAYGDVPAVREASLEVRAGEAVALVGPNGAGKSSLCCGVVGLCRVVSGSVEIHHNGCADRLDGKPPWAVARRGILYVPETGHVFAGMTVEENLQIAAAASCAGRAQKAEFLDGAFRAFPVLHGRRKQLAGTLSGGERRMLAMARAFVSLHALRVGSDKFRLLILDEPTHGLDPRAIFSLRDLLGGMKENGLALLLVEQMVPFALELASRGYVMRAGRIVASGSSRELLDNQILEELYIGG